MATPFKTRFLTLLMALSFTLPACSQAGSNRTEEQQAEEAAAPRPQVVITTPYGDITLALYNETPEHRDNFLKLAREGFFDGTLFHRVIEGFMIQGGDPESRQAEAGQPVGSGGPGYTLPAEIVDGLFHKKGALAAARMGDQVNPERRSSGSQFYIVQGRAFRNEELDGLEQQTGRTIPQSQREVYTTLGGTPHLDQAYTVFGEVVDGLDVVDRIAAVETGPGDRPLENVAMTVTVIE
jgi:peptidyl-prolyl cis-trans isomerase B (cyclophilin B)